MRRSRPIALASAWLVAGALAAPVFAQALEVPAPSPRASAIPQCGIGERGSAAAALRNDRAASAWLKA